MKKTNNQTLTDQQIVAIRWSIINSMLDSYIESTGDTNVSEVFQAAAGRVADNIIKVTQMSLLQGCVFDKAVQNSCPAKGKITKKAVKKTVKKSTKTTKKHVR